MNLIKNLENLLKEYKDFKRQLGLNGFNWHEDYKKISHNAEIIEEAIKKLKYYEELKTKNMLIEFPCELGTVIYKIESNNFACYSCKHFKGGLYEEDDYCICEDVKKDNECDEITFPQFEEHPLCEKHYFYIKEFSANKNFILNNMDSYNVTWFTDKVKAQLELENFNEIWKKYGKKKMHTLSKECEQED